MHLHLTRTCTVNNWTVSKKYFMTFFNFRSSKLFCQIRFLREPHFQLQLNQVIFLSSIPNIKRKIVVASHRKVAD